MQRRREGDVAKGAEQGGEEDERVLAEATEIRKGRWRLGALNDASFEKSQVERDGLVTYSFQV